MPEADLKKQDCPGQNRTSGHPTQIPMPQCLLLYLNNSKHFTADSGKKFEGKGQLQSFFPVAGTVFRTMDKLPRGFTRLSYLSNKRGNLNVFTRLA